MIFTINDCLIDSNAYEVRRDGKRVPVEPQVFDLLVQLLENRDRVVTKDEIIQRVWHGRIVSEAALSSRIKAVRQAIGDDGASQALIRTVRRRGFRVIAPVTASPGGSAGRAPPATELPSGDGPAAAEAAPLSAACCDVGEPPWVTAANAAASPEAAVRGRSPWVLAGFTGLLLCLSVAWSMLPTSPVTPLPIAPAALGMPAGPGIAVLSFNNVSGDRSLNFFRDAVTEEIITQLTRFSELRVTARGATSEYDSKEIDPKEVARKLGVEFLKEACGGRTSVCVSRRSC